jgi:hypothetical protein
VLIIFPAGGRGAVIDKSVWPFATGWTVRELDPGGGNIFHNRPDQTWGPTQPPIQWLPDLFPGEGGG